MAADVKNNTTWQSNQATGPIGSRPLKHSQLVVKLRIKTLTAWDNQAPMGAESATIVKWTSDAQQHQSHPRSQRQPDVRLGCLVQHRFSLSRIPEPAMRQGSSERARLPLELIHIDLATHFSTRTEFTCLLVVDDASVIGPDVQENWMRMRRDHAQESRDRAISGFQQSLSRSVG
ncbi:uncharacterized protein UHOD_11196 [Ustilago sp. UG-2017b]|nr:uncharacterized protein UHOD_11196 [Ustilago sp. UG-2017b]